MDELEKDMKALLCKTMQGEKEPLLDIITILYLEPNEISLEEISEKTGYSLASISIAMKTLETLNLVERIRKPKTKKVYFKMEKDLAKINLQKINYISKHINEVLNQLPLIISKYSKSDEKKDKKIKEKLKIIQTYYEQLKDLNLIVENWKKDLEKMMLKWQRQ